MSEQKLDRYHPSELDDEVEVCLAFEVAALEAKLEAMAADLFEAREVLGELTDINGRTVEYEADEPHAQRAVALWKKLAAAQEREE